MSWDKEDFKWVIVLSEEDGEEEASSADPPNTTEEETSGAHEDAVKESSETESAGLILHWNIDMTEIWGHECLSHHVT